ncbi:NAD-binding protein [Burkholderia cepacia]|uniref:NAD-binding protein n=1 Tax=Burkholderia cepacia TaxID=292 RepID=UPI000ADAC2DD|nr:NAD-binding protein [Burkholderia cepacia]
MISLIDTTAQADEVITEAGGFIGFGPTGRRRDKRPAATLKDAGVARQWRRYHRFACNRNKNEAKEGTLKFYVGARAAALEKIRSILESMTSQVVYLGDVGNDMAVKLIDNMLFRANRVLTIEVLALGAKVALDPTQMVEVISDTASNSVAFQ